jgi:hypothetical protein
MIRIRTKPLRLERVADDIKDDIKKSRKRAMARTVLHGTTIIEERTAQGKGFRGAFKGYSSGWKRVRAALGLETAKVNLEFGYERRQGTPVSGGERVMSQEKDRWQKRPSMLAALQGKVVNRSTGEIFFSRADAAKRAAMVNEKRKFFGFNRDEEKDLARVYFGQVKIKDRRR